MGARKIIAIRQDDYLSLEGALEDVDMPDMLPPTRRRYCKRLKSFSVN